MKNHTKVYMTYFDYGIQDMIPCEIPDCVRRCVDVHHIENRKRGGDKSGEKDKIENLMGLCREHHDEHGDVPDSKKMLTTIHLNFMKNGKQY